MCQQPPGASSQHSAPRPSIRGRGESPPPRLPNNRQGGTESCGTACPSSSCPSSVVDGVSLGTEHPTVCLRSEGKQQRWATPAVKGLFLESQQCLSSWHSYCKGKVVVVLAQHLGLKNDLFTLEKIREGHRLYNKRKEWGWLIALANNGGKKLAILFKEENKHCSKHADNPHQTQIWFLCVNVWSSCNLYGSCSSFKWMQCFWNSWNECCLWKETMDVVNKQISCQQLSNKGAENSIRGELSMGFLMIHLSRTCSVGTGTEQLPENVSALHTPKSGDRRLLLAISSHTDGNVFKSRDQLHALQMKSLCIQGGSDAVSHF